MAEILLEDIDYRLGIIAEIKGNENEIRMTTSQKACDVYSGVIKPYVDNHLVERFSDNTVKQMAVVSSINVTSKIVDIKGSVYKEAPERSFNDVSDSQEETLEYAYNDMNLDAKMLRSNRLFELQRHNHIQIIPKKGKLSARCLKNHQVNVIPSDLDQEVGEIYILSSFDRENMRVSDGEDQDIADTDDYTDATERYIVWSPSYHFIMDGRGSIISGEDIYNPIAPIIPIVEVADDKDYEYWMNQNESLTDFTIEYNSLLSSLGFQVDMQGHAQAYLKGDKELMPSPSEITVGISKILILPTSANSGQDIEFGFVSPNGDLAGSQSYAESILSMFLSSNNIDPKAITGTSSTSTGYSSGVERLLSMIEKFEASKDTQHIYKGVESEIFKVVSAWINLSTADLLNNNYKTQAISDDATVTVKFKRPDAEISDTEKLAVIEKELELELITRLEAIAKYRELNTNEAKEKMEEIDSANEPVVETMPEEENNIIDDNMDMFEE